MSKGFNYIETKDALKKASDEWKNAKSFGIDLECENNLHHYGQYISLIQISTNTAHWIVDVLALDDVKEVVKLFNDPEKQKIFHNVSFDLRIIERELKCRPKNIFDTQIAAQFLDKKSVGLGPLLEEYFGIKKEHKFQMADWTKRPLGKDMLEYATKDTHYLIKLRDRLKDELKRKGMLSWVEEEFKMIETNKFEQRDMTFEDMKGYSVLTDRERAMLKRIFLLRERVAKKVNRPVHFVLNSRQMLEIVKNPPKRIDDWRIMRGVHPVVKRKAEEFFYAIQKGKKEEIRLMPGTARRLTQEQRKESEKLNSIREKIAKRIGIQSHLIMNKEQIQQIVVTGKKDSLRDWQRKLVEKEIKQDKFLR